MLSIVSDQNVVWLEVVVDEAKLVDCLQTVDQLDGYLDYSLQTEFLVELLHETLHASSQFLHYDAQASLFYLFVHFHARILSCCM